jgi:hypothetical protein
MIVTLHEAEQAAELRKPLRSLEPLRPSGYTGDDEDDAEREGPSRFGAFNAAPAVGALVIIYALAAMVWPWLSAAARWLGSLGA